MDPCSADNMLCKNLLNAKSTFFMGDNVERSYAPKAYAVTKHKVLHISLDVLPSVTSAISRATSWIPGSWFLRKWEGWRYVVDELSMVYG